MQKLHTPQTSEESSTVVKYATLDKLSAVNLMYQFGPSKKGEMNHNPEWRFQSIIKLPREYIDLDLDQINGQMIQEIKGELDRLIIWVDAFNQACIDHPLPFISSLHEMVQDINAEIDNACLEAGLNREMVIKALTNPDTDELKELNIEIRAGVETRAAAHSIFKRFLQDEIESNPHEDNIHEEQIQFSGHFIGYLPYQRIFEFKADETNSTISGFVGIEIKDADQISDNLLKPASITLVKMEVGDSTTLIRLVKFNFEGSTL